MVLRGVNVPDPVWGTERAEARGNGYWETLRLATDAESDWHAHVLRIPVEPQSIEEVGVGTIASDYLDRAVSLAAEQGVYALIDYHAVERYDTEGVDERLREFWGEIAPRYAEDSHVLYELFSEPTEPAGDGIDAWRTWKETAEPWVDLVRSEAPETPIVVGSPRWSSMTNHAAAEPFDDDNVLYSAHIYPSWDPESWEPTFGDPAFDVPVFVTEWGYVDDRDAADTHVVGSTESWGRPFRQWLDAHENVSWCARAFDSRWEPPMFDEDWDLLGGDAHMGTLTKQWLADRRDSHWPPQAAGAPTATPVVTGRPPDPPADLHVEGVGKTTTKIAWDGAIDPDGDDVLQYRVAVGDGERRTLRGSVRSFELTGLSPGRDYTATVTAVDEFGLESDPAQLQFSTAEAVDPKATIPRAPSAPTVDRAVDDVWERADPHDIGVLAWGEEADVSAQWRALWDEEALYLLVSVSDTDIRENDAVEVFLDLDNSAGDSYDGENDLQLVMVPGIKQAWQGPNSATSEPVFVRTDDTGEGWRVELSVPWADYDVTPLAGMRFGMDVHVADDSDSDDDRDAKYVWHDRRDRAWQTPARFATVALGE